MRLEIPAFGLCGELEFADYWLSSFGEWCSCWNGSIEWSCVFWIQPPLLKTLHGASSHRTSILFRWTIIDYDVFSFYHETIDSFLLQILNPCKGIFLFSWVQYLMVFCIWGLNWNIFCVEIVSYLQLDSEDCISDGCIACIWVSNRMKRD